MADQEFIMFAAKVAADLGMTLDETWEPTWNGARITDGRGKSYHLAPVRGSSDRTEIRMMW